MTKGRLLGRMTRALRHRGLAQNVYRYVLRGGAGEFARPHPFDKEHGTDTSGALWGEDVWVGSASDSHNVGYVGTPPSRLREGLSRWQSTLEGERLEDFSFVDLGCGKGRALLIASERPFRQALGVELSPTVIEAARLNAQTWQAAGKAKCPLRLINEDVTEVALPEGPCLLYIYNAFSASITQSVLANLEKKVAAEGCRVDLLFHTELSDNPLPSDGRVRRLWSTNLPISFQDAVYDPVASREDVTSLYRWKASDSGSGI